MGSFIMLLKTVPPTWPLSFAILAGSASLSFLDPTLSLHLQQVREICTCWCLKYCWFSLCQVWVLSSYQMKFKICQIQMIKWGIKVAVWYSKTESCTKMYVLHVCQMWVSTIKSFLFEIIMYFNPFQSDTVTKGHSWIKGHRSKVIRQKIFTYPLRLE